ncbi:hypothetical protein FZW07_04315 [Campylobacter jejuni]|nr:hypothetical protein [Campylobacter jejuni]ECQ6501715.1 hypothetical protein [Campylobacter jejuni]
MKKLGLVLAALVALNVSAFADLIVINKKDLVPVSASEMQNKYFQERNAKQIFPREYKINFN